MRAAALISLCLFCVPLSAQETMTPELLWQLLRVGGGDVSPDGKSVLLSARRYDLAANSGDSDLWVVPIGGGSIRRLTSEPVSESDAQWVLRDGKLGVLFVAKRGDDTWPQVWFQGPDGPRRVTEIEGGVANLVVSPDGKRIAFTRDVKMDPTVQDLYPDLPKADARIIDGLMYRHWSAWHDFAYSHLHVASLGDDGTAGPATDLMAGIRADCPVPPFGGTEQIAWAPDSGEIAFTAKITEDWARSTDSGIYVVDLVADEPRMRCVSAGLAGWDTDPSYSPDGRWLAFLSMERPGFEADRNRIMLVDRSEGDRVEITGELDQTAHELTWAPDSQSLFFMSEYRGSNQIFQLELEGRAVRQVSAGRFNWSLRDVTPDGTGLLVARQDMIRPWELCRLSIDDGKVLPITGFNDSHYSELETPTIEERQVTATDGKSIHCWVIYPPRFDPAKKYPLITYCQGGPQGQIGQWFSYRWNFHLMAAQGYVVLAPNRRGLPGFGRAWNDEISKDWGGQAMRDILSAHDAFIAEPFVDPQRTAAIGASFGGYTAYWLMGNGGDRFACMIAHCGVFNLESMYGATEELWFPDWDLGGPYWESAEIQAAYERFSPHRFVGRWKTPLLVVHGQKDFRVPVTQGMEAFTAAQVRGVPSRFLYFPDEGHWVLGPQNGVLWHRVFFDWLGRYCKPGR